MRGTVDWVLGAVLLVAASATAQHPAVPLPPALEPASTGGVEAVDRALAKLSSHRRVLVVGAHPDDEDNSVLAWVSRGEGGEVAYLALSRGEGGQNLIGPELGVGLGLVRTGELLAARRVEGGRQLFARAYDFGYTRSLEETGRRWPRSALLEDAVRATRRFKPQVVVSVFPADARAGHGQHQMAGVIARALFDGAGEPDRFPELTAAGLPPWRPEALYRRAWSREQATLGLSLGVIEPLSGRSLRQIAALSRSMHRSQDMGREQELGGRMAGLEWVAGGGGADGSEPFAGIDTRLAAIAGTLPEGGARAEVSERLEGVESLARRARARLNPRDLRSLAPDLAAIVGELEAALARLEEAPGPAEAVADLLREKLAVAAAGLTAAAGVALEATAERAEVVAGDELAVRATVWNAGSDEIAAAAVEVVSPAGWAVSAKESPDSPPGGRLGPGALAHWEFSSAVPAGAPPTLPYFLLRPRIGDLYDWSAAAEDVRGEPYQPPPLLARFELRLEGVDVSLEREVVYRYGDQAVGEVRRPLRAVPALEVAVEPQLSLWRTGVDREKELEITLRANVERRLSGRLEVAFDGGLEAAGPVAFSVGGRGGGRALRLVLRPSAELEAGTHVGAVTAVLDSGERYAAAYPLLEYPHVRPAPMRVPARVEVRVLDLELPRARRVGYVRGAADRVPEMLREVGLAVEVMSGDELEHGDLERYDVIVVGSRAYETDPHLGRFNDRLLEFARGGGRLLVQYQQYPYVRGGFAPFALDIARPHGRVTDEEAPVEMLDPAHAAFTRPNRIGPGDWEGWVTERGLYFADSWDPAFTPLLALRDQGQPEQRGALLVARTGEGWYVYTGLSFFRQLPAGVPGAYRLFANLLALGER